MVGGGGDPPRPPPPTPTLQLVKNHCGLKSGLFFNKIKTVMTGKENNNLEELARRLGERL